MISAVEGSFNDRDIYSLHSSFLGEARFAYAKETLSELNAGTLFRIPQFHRQNNMQNTRPINTDKIITFLIMLVIVIIAIVCGINAHLQSAKFDRELREMPMRAAENANE